MKRRDFFKLGISKAAEITSEVAKAKVALRADNWIRPPFAKPEHEFLSSCTRCDDCISACPYDVLFRLPAKLGTQVEGTPAMDLGFRGCHMCSDWPCVEACEPKALMLPDVDDETDEETTPAPAKFAHVTINQKTCLPYSGPECGACKQSCPTPGALNWQDGIRPAIDNTVCTGCALCREACIVDPKAIDVRPFVE